MRFIDTTGDGIDDLWLNEPERVTGTGRESGVFYGWFGSPEFPTGTLTHSEQDADVCAAGSQARSRFGASFAFAKGMNGNYFAVGAPRYGSAMNGIVDIYDFRFILRRNERTKTWMVDHKFDFLHPYDNLK